MLLQSILLRNGLTDLPVLLDKMIASPVPTMQNSPHTSMCININVDTDAGVWEILCRESCGTSSTVSVSCAPSCFYGSIDEQRGRHGCFSWSL